MAASVDSIVHLCVFHIDVFMCPCAHERHADVQYQDSFTLLFDAALLIQYLKKKASGLPANTQP